MAWLLAVPPPGLAFYAVSVEKLTCLFTDIEARRHCLDAWAKTSTPQMIARAG